MSDSLKVQNVSQILASLALSAALQQHFSRGPASVGSAAETAKLQQQKPPAQQAGGSRRSRGRSLSGGTAGGRRVPPAPRSRGPEVPIPPHRPQRRPPRKGPAAPPARYRAPRLRLRPAPGTDEWAKNMVRKASFRSVWPRPERPLKDGNPKQVPPALKAWCRPRGCLPAASVGCLRKRGLCERNRGPRVRV